MHVKNLHIMKKTWPVIVSFALVATLTGCSNEKNTDDNLEETTINQVDNTSQETTNMVDEIVKIQEDASSEVEAAVTIMLESADSLAEASEEAKQTPAYQESKEQVKQNFDDLFGFLFQNEEIAGYTISDVSDNTVDYCSEALLSLDEYIESYIPEYKDKAKEKLVAAGYFIEDKLTDAGAWAIDKGSELKEKTLQKYYDKYGSK